MEILDGKKLAGEIKTQVKFDVENFCKEHRAPMLACILVDGDKASEIYVSSKVRACEECGILSKVVRLSSKITQTELEKAIDNLNKDININAILLQLPLPPHLDSNSAINKISPLKDVDCLTDTNLGSLFSGKNQLAPCTAQGIMKLLNKYKIAIEGKRAVVIGRSLLVGKSVSCLLEQSNATVTICHSKTQNLKSITKDADILVVAIGKAKMITTEFIKEGAVVIDVGINRESGKIYGDVDFENVKEKCSYITPVPGGVGPLTVACLMENTLKLSKRQCEGGTNSYTSC